MYGIVGVTRPVVRVSRISCECRGSGILRSVGLAVGSKSFLKVIKPGNSKGSALLGLVLGLLGIRGKDIGLFNGRVDHFGS